MKIECPSTYLKLKEEVEPVFEIVKRIPDGLSSQIEDAVMDFIKTSHSCPGVDAVGFYNQTLEAIAGATILGQGGDFWLAIDSQGVFGYALCRIVKDVDNRLTYWCAQSWLRKDMRGLEWYKFGMDKIRERAKSCFCAHLVIVSSRNAEAYLRFLGKNWNKYATLLKEDI
jgi:hypothetical protein